MKHPKQHGVPQIRVIGMEMAQQKDQCGDQALRSSCNTWLQMLQYVLKANGFLHRKGLEIVWYLKT